MFLSVFSTIKIKFLESQAKLCHKYIHNEELCDGTWHKGPYSLILCQRCLECCYYERK